VRAWTSASRPSHASVTFQPSRVNESRYSSRLSASPSTTSTRGRTRGDESGEAVTLTTLRRQAAVPDERNPQTLANRLFGPGAAWFRADAVGAATEQLFRAIRGCFHGTPGTNPATCLLSRWRPQPSNGRRSTNPRSTTAVYSCRPAANTRWPAPPECSPRESRLHVKRATSFTASRPVVARGFRQTSGPPHRFGRPRCGRGGRASETSGRRWFRPRARPFVTGQGRT
jgi:hypothetical protein